MKSLDWLAGSYISSSQSLAELNHAPWCQMPAFLIIPGSIMLILAGIVVAPLPIPFGVPMIIIGVVALISHSPLAARMFAGLRGRWSRFDHAVRFLEVRAPRVMARALLRTRPRL